MADNNGGGSEDRLERIKFLVSTLQQEQLREQSLEDRGKLDGQIGFTDLFRNEVGQWLKEIDRKLSELSNG